MWPLNISDLPPPGALPEADDVRAPVLDLLPLHLEADVLRARRARARPSPARRRSGSGSRRGRLRARRAGRRRSQRKCGSTSFPNSSICSWRRVAPELEHHVRAAGVAVLLDRGDAVGRRAGDRLALVEDLVRHLRLRREPAALLHRLGDRADLVLASGPRGRAACRPRPGCSAPCSRGTCRRSRARRRGPPSRSDSWIEATTVQPMSMSAATFSRV